MFQLLSAAGVDLVLWDDMHVGTEKLDLGRVSKGRCVEDMGLCGVDLCLNSGQPMFILTVLIEMLLRFVLASLFYNTSLTELPPGVCDASSGTEECSCTGTGYTGRYCEVLDTGACTVECLNGGMCSGGYCHCPLGFHGN